MRWAICWLIWFYVGLLRLFVGFDVFFHGWGIFVARFSSPLLQFVLFFSHSCARQHKFSPCGWLLPMTSSLLTMSSMTLTSPSSFSLYRPGTQSERWDMIWLERKRKQVLKAWPWDVSVWVCKACPSQPAAHLLHQISYVRIPAFLVSYISVVHMNANRIIDTVRDAVLLIARGDLEEVHDAMNEQLLQERLDRTQSIEDLRQELRQMIQGIQNSVDKLFLLCMFFLCTLVVLLYLAWWIEGSLNQPVITPRQPTTEVEKSTLQRIELVQNSTTEVVQILERFCWRATGLIPRSERFNEKERQLLGHCCWKGGGEPQANPIPSPKNSKLVGLGCWKDSKTARQRALNVYHHARFVVAK